MCYIGKAKSSRKVRIAKKDIKTFKFGTLRDGKVIPYYQSSSGVIYNEGEEYHEKINPVEYKSNKDKESFELRVTKGLYSFAKSRAYCGKIDRTTKYLNCNTRTVVQVKERFFPLSYGQMFYNYPENNIVLMECHIPKGTKYLMDWHGETVSETLVVDKITLL